MYKFDTNYCNNCGDKIEKIVPEGDQKLRDVCISCGAIHYKNPKIITGCLIEHDAKILLCQRKIEPQYGKWTLPAGFMENNETTVQGAARETLEEANAEIIKPELYGVYDIPHISQVYMIYRAQLAGTGFSPGDESLAVDLFDRFSLPWELLAFSVIKELLQNYFADIDNGEYQLHTGIITPEMKATLGQRPQGF